MKIQNKLLVPLEYSNIIANAATISLNGCGSSGISAAIVPDKLFGLDISQACNIHDYMYENGGDKNQADNIFLKNMNFLIDQESDSKILKVIRIAKAYVYFLAVKIFGKPSLKLLRSNI